MSDTKEEVETEPLQVEESKPKKSTPKAGGRNLGLVITQVGLVLAAVLVIVEALIIVGLLIGMITVGELNKKEGGPVKPSGAEIYEFLDRGAQIIDVRNPELFAEDAIDGAVNVQTSEVGAEVGKKINAGLFFTQGRDRFTIVYGAVADNGVQSEKIVEALRDRDFINVINGWDLPTVRAQQVEKRKAIKAAIDAGAVIFDTRNEQAWSDPKPDEGDQLPVDGSQMLYWEDVRFSIDPLAHKPLGRNAEFEAKVGVLPKDTHIITYCWVEVWNDCPSFELSWVAECYERSRY